MKLTNQQIETLKGECPECKIQGTALHNFPCETCNNSGKSAIEIEKELVEKEILGVETQDGKFPYRTKIKIPKYKVGDEINGYYHFNSGIGRIIIKLKIISETEKHWRVMMI